MTTGTEGKALIIQTVSIDLPVAIEAYESDLNIDLDDLRAHIVDHVKKEILGSVLVDHAEDIYARRTTTGYSYYSPEYRSKVGEPDIMNVKPPLRVSLTDLGYEETKS